jgi:hypothetical protein
MKEKDELKLSRTLSQMEGQSELVFPWGKGTISVKYINYSAGGSGCPDSLLLIKISMPILGKNVTLQAPILVEAEKAGIRAAIQDLDKFCERSIKGALENGGSSFIEIPMLVATPSPRYKGKNEARLVKARFNVQETRLD